MRGRDLFILAAVLLVGGFAVADAIRSEGDPTRPRTEADAPTTTSVVTRTPPPEDLGRARFPAVPEAGGSLVFTQTGSCAVREVDLPSGQELPNAVARSSCELWAAPVTAKVAVGIGAAEEEEAVPFRFVDLSRPSQNLGGSRALFGFLVWSDDGQRAAWCTRPTTGFDLELGGPSTRLPECPAAYTPGGEIAYARENRVEVDGRTELRASGAVTLVNYARDGSTAVMVEGATIERWVDGRRRQAFELPPALQGRNPIFSPDNCAALFREGDTMRLVDVGCFPLEEGAFPGTTAAWSPDGRWIAVGGPSRLTFHDLEGGQPVGWPVGAVDVVWRR